jgi:two-component system, chemotaxis family, chemotaxis protein CheY
MGKIVFVVDGSATLRQIIGLALKGAGYHVLEAVDGREALSMLDGRTIHLIVSGLDMPHIDGINFIKLAKQLPSYKFIPVIMLAHDDSKSQNGLAHGVTSWMLKPFHTEQLLAVAAKLTQY